MLWDLVKQAQNGQHHGRADRRRSPAGGAPAVARAEPRSDRPPTIRTPHDDQVAAAPARGWRRYDRDGSRYFITARGHYDPRRRYYALPARLLPFGW